MATGQVVGTTTGMTTGRERCVHGKGGTCTIHGPGARRCWRPIPDISRGPGGEIVRKYSGRRETYYLCDVDRNGVLRRQPRLSFNQNEDNPRPQDKQMNIVRKNTSTGGN